MRPRTALLWVFVASVAVAAAMGVIGLLGGQGIFLERILTTTLVFGLSCIPAVVLAMVREKARLRVFTSFGFGVIVVAATLWLLIIWDVVGRYSFFGPTNLLFDATLRAAGVFSVLSFWSAIFAAVCTVTLERWWGILARLASMSLTSMAGAIICVAIVAEAIIEPFSDEYGRATGAVGIVGLAATLAIPALRRLERAERDDSAETTIARRPVVVCRCPRCGVEQSMSANTPSRCESCGLRIRIEVEEPRCKCGYLLYGVDGDGCPECGVAIERWASESDSANQSPRPSDTGGADESAA